MYLTLLYVCSYKYVRVCMRIHNNTFNFFLFHFNFIKMRFVKNIDITVKFVYFFEQYKTANSSRRDLTLYKANGKSESIVCRSMSDLCLSGGKANNSISGCKEYTVRCWMQQ